MAAKSFESARDARARPVGSQTFVQNLQICKSVEDDSPPAKKLKEADSKLKQARLPFKPLDQKPLLVPSGTPPGSKKRKHSDGESPCAKPPKTPKSNTTDHPQIAENDPEVNSNAEAENSPVQIPKPRVRSTLERFIRRDAQEEVTGCIDLTNEISKENKCKTDDNKDLNKENEHTQKTKPASKDKENKINASPVKKYGRSSETSKLQSERCDATEAQENQANAKIEVLDLKGDKSESKESDKDDTDKNDDVQMEISDDDNEKKSENGDSEHVQTENMSDVSSTSGSDKEVQTPTKSKEHDSNLGTPVSAKLSDSLLHTPLSEGTPGPKMTPSSQSPGDSCSDSTPKSSAKKLPRKLSDSKKKERDLLRNKIKEEKEREREEKKRQKEQERLEKEQQKEKMRKEREEAKAEKDRIRKEEKEKKEKEKEKKEKERLEKLQQKEEEKKKKQDIQDAKMEEKRKKEEEKQKEEEEKRQKDMKLKEKFSSFFIKQRTSPVSKQNKENSGLFMPFELKKDMMLAPCFDLEVLSEDRKNNIDEALLAQEKCQSELYLAELRGRSHKPRKTKKTCRIDLDNDVMLVHDSETVKKVTYHCKLMQFHTNYRPPYYGTWRRKSKVLSPRNPFKTDNDMLDYEVDSDDEWEEEEPGESLSASEGEDEKEENSDDDEEDGWMVPHGYLSEGEGCEDDEEVTPEMLKARQKAKADQWESEQKRQKQPAIHTIIGCFWEHAAEKIQKELEEKLHCYRAVCLVEDQVPTTFTGASSKKGDNGGADKKEDARMTAQRKPVPEEAMPDLIRLVHGNLVGMKKLVKEFRLYWKQKTSGEKTEEEKETNMEVDENQNCGITKEDNPEEMPKDNENNKNDDNFAISKRQLEMKISAIAVREKRDLFKKFCWYVHEPIQQQYKMTDLPVPSTWEFISQPHKTPNKPKPDDAPGSGRKTPTPIVERKTPTQSITQFAKPMSPTTLQAQFAAANAAAQAEKQKIAQEQAAKLAAQNAAVVTSNAVPMDCVEVSQPKKDQKSIKDFATNIFSPPKTHEWKMTMGGKSAKEGKRLVLVSNSTTPTKAVATLGNGAATDAPSNSPKSVIPKNSPIIHKTSSSPVAVCRVKPVLVASEKSKPKPGNMVIPEKQNSDKLNAPVTTTCHPIASHGGIGSSASDAIVLD